MRRLREMGKKILLFVREHKEDEYGLAMSYVFLGEASFVKSYGTRPMSIEWRLTEHIPASLLKESRKSSPDAPFFEFHNNSLSESPKSELTSLISERNNGSLGALLSNFIFSCLESSTSAIITLTRFFDLNLSGNLIIIRLSFWTSYIFSNVILAF